jgi:hypothetical protein
MKFSNAALNIAAPWKLIEGGSLSYTAEMSSSRQRCSKKVNSEQPVKPSACDDRIVEQSSASSKENPQVLLLYSATLVGGELRENPIA